MFTLDHIQDAFAKVQTGADFPQFVKDLQVLGVTHYLTHVADGRTSYFGRDETSVEAGPKYPNIPIAATGSPAHIKEAIGRQQRGETDYPTFCHQVAAAGVDRWTVHLIEKTVSYYDLAGAVLVAEPF